MEPETEVPQLCGEVSSCLALRMLVAPEPRDAVRPTAFLVDAAAEEAASQLVGHTRPPARRRVGFLDHGAEFFSTVDPEFALELALDNLEIRTEDRAYQIALESALAADDDGAACDLARQATLEAHPGFLRPTVPLRELAHEVLADCE